MSATPQNVYAVYFEGGRAPELFPASDITELAERIHTFCAVSNTPVNHLKNVIRIERVGQLAGTVAFKEVARA